MHQLYLLAACRIVAVNSFGGWHSSQHPLLAQKGAAHFQGLATQDAGQMCHDLGSRPYESLCPAISVNKTWLTPNRDAQIRPISAKTCSFLPDFELSKTPLNIVALP